MWGKQENAVQRQRDGRKDIAQTQHRVGGSRTGTETYRHLLELGKKGGLFLDIGCCCEYDSLFVLICLSDASGFSVGTDARKAVADGFPVKQVILSDLREGTSTLRPSYIRTLLSPV